MARFRPTRVLGEGALKALNHLGGLSLTTWVLALALLVILHTFVDQLSEWVRHHDAWWWMWVPTAALGTILVVLYLLARTARRSLQPRAVIDAHPPPVKALILFLSSPGELPYGEISGALGETALGAAFGPKRSWRMPVAAVAHHIGRLERLVVFVSSGENGTSRHFAAFKELVERLLPKGRTLRIETSGEFLRGKRDEGIDFENPQDLIEELEKTYEHLRGTHVRERDILIDVTGGTKVSTAAAVAFTALWPDRDFQYVSTNTYQVRSFDVTWDLEHLRGAG